MTLVTSARAGQDITNGYRISKLAGFDENIAPQISEKSNQGRKHMKTKNNTSGYIIRGSAVAVLLVLALVALTSAFNLVNGSPSLPLPYAPSLEDFVLPQVADVVHAVRTLAAY